MPLLIFLSMAMMLVSGRSYSYIPAIFVLVVIGYQLYCKHTLRVEGRFLEDRPSLAIDKRWLKASIYSLLFYFFIHLIYMIGFHEKLRTIDNAYKSIIFLPILLYWIKSNVEKSIHAFFLGSAVGGSIGGMAGTYGYFVLHAPRAFDYPYMYIQAGDMCMTLGLFSLVGLFYGSLSKQKYKFIMAAGVIGGIWGSIISGSRGGWLILVPAIVFILYMFRERIAKKTLFITIGIALITIVVAVATPQTGIWQRYVDMRQDIHQYENNHVNTSLGLRFNMWEGAWIGIKEKPLLGWGTSGAQNLKKEQVAQGVLVKEAAEFNHVHNQLLNDWYERGILGFLSGIAIFLVPMTWFSKVLYNYSQKSNPFIMACAGMIHVAATFSYGLSQGFLEHNSGNVFFFFTLILIISLLWQSIKENGWHEEIVKVDR